MNSNSRYYHEDTCGCEKEKEKKDCRPRKDKEEYDSDYEWVKKEKKDCPSLIKCSTPGAITIPTATIVSTTFAPTSLTLNTNGLKNTCAKIEFTSNIVATAFTGSLSFQVFKQCSNQFVPVPVGPSFSYTRLVAIDESSTFSFFICDCDSCFNDCCTYTVVVTVNAITVGVLAINNATLGAVVGCQANGCC